VLGAAEYRAALSAAPDAMLIVDASGNIHFASERVQATFGYSPEELIGTSIDALVPSAYRAVHAAHRAAFARAPSARAMGRVGLFGQRKDGSRVAVEISLAPVQTAEGLRIICAVRDAALHPSELSRLFMSHMPGAAAMLDRNMRYIAVTKAWLLEYGLALSPRDAVGISHYELFPEIPPRWREIHQRALQGESFRGVDDSFIRGDGRTEWIDWEVQPWRTLSGEIGGILIFSEVTTARHEAAAALAESESRFRGAFDYSSIGMALVAPEGRWLRVNQALCDILGYSAAELLATTFQELTHPDDLRIDLPFVREMLAGSRSHYHKEKRYRHKDGHVIWAMLTTSLVRDAAARPLYFVTQIQDITQRKLALDRIHALLQRLESLREDERREVSQLIHEGVMQQLVAMSLTLNLLAERSKARADILAVCRELSMTVDKCFADLRELANDLRPTALAHLPLAAALTEHAEYFARLSKLQIQVIEQPPFPTLNEATKLLLFRAAQEALTNVARHAQARSVRISLRANATHVFMEVVDDGIGIDAAALWKPGSLGLLGLGERIRSNGGELRVEGNQGRGASGTTLRVSLPREGAVPVVAAPSLVENP